MLAGLIYGLIEALVTALLGSTYTQIVTFALVILALAVHAERAARPRGNEEGMSDAACARLHAIADDAGDRRADRGGRGYIQVGRSTRISSLHWSR